MDWDTHKKILLKDPAFRKALKETELEYQVARAVIRARIDQNLTQTQLARKLKTRQSVISRVENAKTLPSLSFLKRLAKALNSSISVRFQ